MQYRDIFIFTISDRGSDRSTPLNFGTPSTEGMNKLRRREDFTLRKLSGMGHVIVLFFWLQRIQIRIRKY